VAARRSAVPAIQNARPGGADTMHAMRLRLTILAAFLAALTACAPANNTSSQAASHHSPSPGSTANSCAKPTLHLVNPGHLTIATSPQVYEPWMVHNDPSNGKGFESAVAYAVAKHLGFSHNQVDWVKEPFNASYQPGPKNFDFDINQISITPQRAKVVDFSIGYYNAAQAIITLKSSKYASANSLADFKTAKLGAQVGTTSLEAIQNGIRPQQAPLVYQDTNNAKSALLNKQIDGIVVDLPTAFYITAVQIPSGTIVGQFQPTTSGHEQFGLLFQQGNPLVRCVDGALRKMKSSGELHQIQQRWLSQVVNVPVLH
jgi:polar amino acid transport system substrate-binding protein